MHDIPPPDYPTLCIRSLEPVPGKPGRFNLDLASYFDLKPEPILEVDQTTIDFLRGENAYDHVVPECPPGWPIPPEPEVADE